MGSVGEILYWASADKDEAWWVNARGPGAEKLPLLDRVVDVDEPAKGNESGGKTLENSRLRGALLIDGGCVEWPLAG